MESTFKKIRWELTLKNKEIIHVKGTDVDKLIEEGIPEWSALFQLANVKPSLVKELEAFDL